jgi:hypothetical protein
MRTTGEVSVTVNAVPDVVYELVADVTRIGEFSPECRGARWLGGATAPQVGARFRGANASSWIRWSRECEVLTAEPGREFAFRTIPTWSKRDSTTWTYRFTATGNGTEVVESYDITRLPPAPLLAVIRRLLPHHLDMRPHMRRTLDALKASAEHDRHDSATPTNARPS